MKSNYSFNSSITCKILKNDKVLIRSHDSSLRNKNINSESFNVLKRGKQLNELHRKLFSSRPWFKKNKGIKFKAAGESVANSTIFVEFQKRAGFKMQSIFSEEKKKSIAIKQVELKVKEEQIAKNACNFMMKKNMPFYINQKLKYKSKSNLLNFRQGS